MSRMIKRGDIFYANLSPVVGSEQGGTRPVLIVQNDVGNLHSPTTIIAPITSKSKSKANLPTHYIVDDIEGLPMSSLILLEQIRTIDKTRLREYIVTLDERAMQGVDKKIITSLGLRMVYKGAKI